MMTCASFVRDEVEIDNPRDASCNKRVPPPSLVFVEITDTLISRNQEKRVTILYMLLNYANYHELLMTIRADIYLTTGGEPVHETPGEVGSSPRLGVFPLEARHRGRQAGQRGLSGPLRAVLAESPQGLLARDGGGNVVFVHRKKLEVFAW